MMEKGEIWIVKFYSKRGREQEGTRPAVIIADTKTGLVLLIPLTSNLEALKKLPFTLEIKKSSENNLEKDSVVLVFQLQTLDKKRLISRIGNIESRYLDKVNEIIKKLLKI